MAQRHPLSRAYERRLRAYRKNIGPACAGDPEAVHDCRVASRRLREMLPVCEVGLSLRQAGRARRRLRRVGRATGGARELDVVLALLDAMAAKGGPGAGAIERLRPAVESLRQTRRDEMYTRLDAQKLAKLDRELRSIGRLLRKADETHTWAQALAARISRRARRVREAVAHAVQTLAHIHCAGMRVATKKLRYAVELAVEGRLLPPVDGMVRQLKSLQDTLGRLHDVEVLAQVIEAVAAHDTGGSTDLQRLRADVQRACRRLHSRYVARRAALLAVADGAAAAAARIWRSRGRPQPGRGVKMSLRPADRRSPRRAAVGEGR